MKKQKEIFKNFDINQNWTLFLDRDGVINKKIEGDYVRNWQQFRFLPKAIDALKILSEIFDRIIIVTNQRGIGRGLMTEQDLENIHKQMLRQLKKNGIEITKIYYCPHDHEKETCNCRKPKTGMALKAKKDFPEIDFEKSIMVGDSQSDIEFAQNAGMKGVLINSCNSNEEKEVPVFNSLYEFARFLKETLKENHQ